MTAKERYQDELDTTMTILSQIRAELRAHEAQFAATGREHPAYPDELQQIRERLQAVQQFIYTI